MLRALPDVDDLEAAVVEERDVKQAPGAGSVSQPTISRTWSYCAGLTFGHSILITTAISPSFAD